MAVLRGGAVSYERGTPVRQYQGHTVFEAKVFEAKVFEAKSPQGWGGRVLCAYCRNGLSAEKIEVRSGTDSTPFPKNHLFVSCCGWGMLFWDKTMPKIA